MVIQLSESYGHLSIRSSGWQYIAFESRYSVSKDALLIFLFRSSYIYMERSDTPDLFESSSCVILMHMRARLSSVSLNVSLNRSSAISMNLEISAS